jgi:hypothetical protein
MSDLIPPNVGNYQIGKANVYFTPAGGVRRHMGNCPDANFQVEAEKLDHFSSMAGIKKKDFSATLSVTGTLKLNLEEVSIENMRLALLGGEAAASTSTEGDGNLAFKIGAVESITGRVEIIGSNDVGPKWTYDFPSVTFTPDDAVSFIGEDFTGLALTGDVLVQDYGGGVSAFGEAILQNSTT